MTPAEAFVAQWKCIALTWQQFSWVIESNFSFPFPRKLGFGKVDGRVSLTDKVKFHGQVGALNRSFFRGLGRPVMSALSACPRPQSKFSAAQVASPFPSHFYGFYGNLCESHPSPRKRIERIERAEFQPVPKRYDHVRASECQGDPNDSSTSSSQNRTRNARCVILFKMGDPYGGVLHMEVSSIWRCPPYGGFLHIGIPVIPVIIPCHPR